MSTLKRYLFEKDLTGGAVVTATGQDGGRPWVRLSQTWFHPQGGGQKSDKGTIAGIPVVHVVKTEDEVDHFLELPSVFSVGQDVWIELDAEGRKANSTLHSGGHLIASVAHERFPGLKAIAGHHWPGEARVEFEGAELPDIEHFQKELIAGIAKAAQEHLPINVMGDPLVARTIQIGTFSAIPCGGTHLEQTSELNDLQVTNIKVKGGRLRVSYR